MSLYAGAVTPVSGDGLPTASLRVIDRLAVTPHAFTRVDRDAALATGMGQGEYVETVSLVSRSVYIDPVCPCRH
ncbi:MAG: hypothetical protein RLW62_11920 [Gammaproteobacteria bacterium]